MKTYFGYIRVSTVKQGQQGSSLQEQRDAIEAFARQRSFIVAEWFEDRETAAKRGRSQFLRMMARLEKRRAAGVILHKIDRGARNLWDWARIQNLLDAGIEVHFAHDSLDMKSRGGRLAADIQAVVAADYVRNLRDEVRKGIRGRLKQGIYPLAAPAGYLNNGKGKVKTIDPVKGPLVRLAFELYASKQYSFRTLRIELQRRGLVRKNGDPLSLCGVTAILRNPFYAGVIRVKKTGELFPGIHEPLISPALFRHVQDILDGKINTPARKHDFLYRRLFKCASCGNTLIGEKQKGIVYYRCQTSSCLTTGVREDVISARLFHMTELMHFSDDEIQEMLPMLDQVEKDDGKNRAEQIRAAGLRLAALKERERRLTDAYVDQLIERDVYQARQASLLLELAEAGNAQQRILSEEGGKRLYIKGFLEFIKALRFDDAEECVPQFREVLRELTSNRSLNGKSPYITLKSPFRELTSELAVLSSALDRYTTRTSPMRSAPRKPSKRYYRQVVHLLDKHLEHWKPPVWVRSPEMKQKRGGPPDWEKHLLNQHPEEDSKYAA